MANCWPSVPVTPSVASVAIVMMAAGLTQSDKVNVFVTVDGTLTATKLLPAK